MKTTAHEPNSEDYVVVFRDDEATCHVCGAKLPIFDLELEVATGLFTCAKCYE